MNTRVIDETEAWIQTLALLENRLSSELVQEWLRPVKLSGTIEKGLVLNVPNRYFKDFISAHFMEDILRAMEEVTGDACQITLRSETEPAPAPTPVPNRKTTVEATSNDPLAGFIPAANNLNPKYTFDTFVVGGNNRLAHAASLAVSENPAKAYNPLFLYGGVGLGKTHLLHAICHGAMKSGKASRVLYTSAEQFMNAFITAVTHSRRQDFQAIYRNIDILLIDDIHFLAGKEGTQEEFFHTFNALHGAHKQIVVSSDRPPKEIPTLQERLLSRFEWGLIADIQAPDLETRIAILQKKAEQEKLLVPHDVMMFIADNVVSNIRQLEGSLIRVAAHASLTGSHMNLDLAKRVLADLMEMRKEKVIDISYIQDAVCTYYQISQDDLLGKRRTKGVVEPRQVAMFLSRQMTQKSFPEIGEAFGGRDHTTIMHACEKVNEDMEMDANFKRVVQQLIEQIKGTV